MNQDDNNQIGLIKATSLVAGNMIGSGVLLAPADSLAQINRIIEIIN